MKLKYIFSLVITIILAFSLVACSSDDVDSGSAPETSVVMQTQTPNNNAATNNDTVSEADDPQAGQPTPPPSIVIQGETIYSGDSFSIVRAPIPGNFDFISTFNESGVARYTRIFYDLSPILRRIAVAEEIQWNQHQRAVPSGQFEVGFVNVFGEILNPGNFDDVIAVGQWSEGFLAVVRGESEDNSRLGFVNMDGETVIPFEFRGRTGNVTLPIPRFINGRAWVSHPDYQVNDFNHQWGVIDTNGNVLVPFEHVIQQILPNGFVRVGIIGNDASRAIVDSSGNRVIDLSEGWLDNFRVADNYLLYQNMNNSRFGAFRTDGSVATPAIHESENSLRSYLGLAVVGSSLEITRDPANPFATGAANMGVVDESGRVVVPFAYNDIFFRNGFFHAARHNTQALLDERPMNEWYDSFIYDEHGNLLRTGTFEIRENNLPTRLVPYADLDMGGNGFEGPFGLMDGSARTILQPEYDHLSLFTNNFAVAMRNGQWYVLQLIEH